MNKQSSSGSAPLSRGTCAREQRCVQQQIKVSVLVHNDGVVAAQLQQVTPETSLDFNTNLRRKYS